MPHFATIVQGLKKLRRPAWWIFLVSGTISYLVDQFFDWLNETYFSLIFLYSSFYCFVLIVFFLNKLFNEKTFHFVTFSFLILFTIIMSSNLPRYIESLGFRWYIYPEASYVKNHCHPVHFKQDGKVYLLGLCDLKIDNAGLANFIFLYDTSGDAALDTDTQSQSGRRDRKEWVSAIRQIFNDDPNEIFEIADFWTYHIDGDFYFANFDEADAEGFIREYGLPPPNSKNPYTSIFYAQPDQKNEQSFRTRR